MQTSAPIIEPNAVYTDDQLYSALGVSSATMARARRDRAIRFTRKGNRIYYMGSWLLAWLEGGDEAAGGAEDNHAA